MKKTVSLLLCAVLILGALAGCGSSKSAVSATEMSAASAASVSMSEPVADVEEPTATESAAEPEPESAQETEAEPEAPAVVIEYPLEGGYTFDVLYAKPTILDATIMSGLDYDFSEVYPDMVEATGVELTWQSVSEQAWETQISLIIAAGDYPDACADRINYTTGNIGLIEDEVMLDLADLLPEHMPNYYALLNSDQAFADCAYNSDGSMTQIVSRGSTFINNGLNVR